MKKLIAPLMIVATLLAAAAAGAYTFNDVKIEKWTGSGSKSAVVVVDFGAKSYAFGVYWDGELTGTGALNMLSAGAGLGVEIGPKWGLVNGLRYDGYYHFSDTDEYDPTASWWQYWTSSNGETWTSPDYGSSSRILTDGAWDGWGWSPPWPDQGSAPVTPVPEPASIIALCSMIGFAGSAKLLRLRRP